MSRCFPFPPPGYEKKSTLDDPDLLKKEKFREKDQKKEKRDENKKGGKEKKDKHRSDEKRREKKEKKERRREKKKEKETNQDADKKEIPSDPKSTVEQSHFYNGETSTEKTEDWAKDRSIPLDGNRVSSSGHSSVIKGVEYRHGTHPPPETKDAKYIQKPGSRTAKEQAGSVKPLLGTEQRNDKGMVRLAVNSSTATLGVGTERDKARTVNGGRIDMGTVEARPPSGNAVVQSSTAFGEHRVGGMARPVEKNIDFRSEGEDKLGANAHDRKAEKRKDRDKDKPSKKDKDMEKQKKKEERAKQKEEKRNRDQRTAIKDSGKSPIEQQSRMKDGSKLLMQQPRIKETSKSPLLQSRIEDSGKSSTQQSKVKEVKMSELLGVPSVSPLNFPRENSKIVSADGSLRKRKEVEPARAVPEDDVGPNKKARPSTSHPLVQNGRSMEPSWSSNLFAPHQAPNHVKAEGSSEVSHASSTFLPDAHTPNHVKAEIKQFKLNGTTDVRFPRRPSPATVHTDQNKVARASRMSSPGLAYVDQKAEAQQLRMRSPATAYKDQKDEAQHLRRPSPATAFADQKAEARQSIMPSSATAYADQKAEGHPSTRPSPAGAFPDLSADAKPVGKRSSSMIHVDQKADVQLSRKPSPTTLFADHKAEVSRKPQHPDTKHLNQVLTVPKPVELSELNDQDWLFDSSSHSGKLKAVNPGDQETRQVWAEAVRIESADIVALPYVIPF